MAGLPVVTCLHLTLTTVDRRASLADNYTQHLPLATKAATVKGDKRRAWAKPAWRRDLLRAVGYGAPYDSILPPVSHACRGVRHHAAALTSPWLLRVSQAYTEFDFQLHMQHFAVLLADKPGDVNTNVLLELKLTHVNTRLQSIVPQT